jgi:ABC-2 type transport system permease protein
VWLILFSQTFRALASTPQFHHLGYRSYLMYFTPAMIVLSVLFTALQSGLTVVTDLDSGMLDKLRTDPIQRSSILVGRLIADAILMVAQAAVVLVVAFALGARFAAGVGGAALAVGLVVLFGIAWAALSDFVALRTADSELTMVIGLFLTLPVLFLTSAFYPRSELPPWLQSATSANPADYVISAGRHLMNFGTDMSDDDPWLTVAEIAEELRVNPATVRLWVSKGTLPATRAGQRKLLIRRSDLDRMLEATRNDPPARGYQPRPRDPRYPLGMGPPQSLDQLVHRRHPRPSRFARRDAADRRGAPARGRGLGTGADSQRERSTRPRLCSPLARPRRRV